MIVDNNDSKIFFCKYDLHSKVGYCVHKKIGQLKKVQKAILVQWLEKIFGKNGSKLKITNKNRPLSLLQIRDKIENESSSSSLSQTVSPHKTSSVFLQHFHSPKTITDEISPRRFNLPSNDNEHDKFSKRYVYIYIYILCNRSNIIFIIITSLGSFVIA